MTCLAAFAFSVVVGVPLGILSAVKRGTFLDSAGKVVALIGQSAPVFWLGIMLMFLFAALALLVVWKHRSNIGRLIRREEPKVGGSQNG